MVCHISGSIINNEYSKSFQLTGYSSQYPIQFRSSSQGQYTSIIDNFNILLSTNYYQFIVVNPNYIISYSLVINDNIINSLNDPEVVYNTYSYPNIVVAISASGNYVQISNNNVYIPNLTQSISYNHIMTDISEYSNKITINYATQDI